MKWNVFNSNKFFLAKLTLSKLNLVLFKSTGIVNSVFIIILRFIVLLTKDLTKLTCSYTSLLLRQASIFPLFPPETPDTQAMHEKIGFLKSFSALIIYLLLVLQLQFFKLMQYFPCSNFSKDPTRTRGRSTFSL